jgi:hypothetical protein
MRFFFAIILSAALSGCAFYSASSRAVVTKCVLPSDQSGTLSGKWKVTPPVPIAFQTGAFADAQIREIAAAADSWNKFYGTTMGFKAIDYGSVTSPTLSSTPKPSSLCSTSIASGSTFSGKVVIYRQTSWPYTNLPNAIALTSFCPTPASGLPNIYMAIMEVNTQNFFNSGQKVPDLQSIFLHEFGHLMGINHSCEATAKTGVPSCNDENLPEDYFFASMFPVFSFDAAGLGEVKRSLLSNDQGRANCLYTPVKTGS